MRIELVNRRQWNTGVALDNAIFEYIEISTTADVANARWATSPPSSTK